ncbi:hypothetical protein SDC9_117226 [bioreactor metagenome]|uniref:Uncharacterized protein n=1 Tax=bioreactor metagenome TaxID=1076179 RepID=A0A645BY77_9ZZZZ
MISTEVTTPSSLPVPASVIGMRLNLLSVIILIASIMVAVGVRVTTFLVARARIFPSCSEILDLNSGPILIVPMLLTMFGSFCCGFVFDLFTLG